MTTDLLRRDRYQFRTRKYKWGRLSLAANMANASQPIFMRLDGDEWLSTPYQTADARHSWGEAFRDVNQWLTSHS